MGLLPNEFYEMDIEDFSLKSEGFLDARIWLERSLRRAVSIIYYSQPFNKTPPSVERLWPILKDAEVTEQVKVNREQNAVNTLASFIRSAQGEKKETN